jgi:ubiquinone/menaquinone biosynthesis C-methylase UbiE
MDKDNEDYFKTRLKYDQKRTVLWDTLCKKVFNSYVPEGGTVVELGAGWCDFINNIHAQKKIAVDIWPGIENHKSGDIETFVSDVTSIPFVADKSTDLIFASNLVEHLTREQTLQMLEECARIISKNGYLILVQPNFRLSYKKYFDDYTHVAIWTDTGMVAFLESLGWTVAKAQGKFLPLTVKSKFPVSSLLIRVYLRSPFKPLAGQMLIVARYSKITDVH